MTVQVSSEFLSLVEDNRKAVREFYEIKNKADRQHAEICKELDRLIISNEELYRKERDLYLGALVVAGAVSILVKPVFEVIGAIFLGSLMVSAFSEYPEGVTESTIVCRDAIVENLINRMKIVADFTFELPAIFTEFVSNHPLSTLTKA